jgi:hypothetical protein
VTRLRHALLADARVPEPLDTPALDVEMTGARLKRALRLPLGGKIRLVAEYVEDEGDWKRLVATSVKVVA